MERTRVYFRTGQVAHILEHGATANRLDGTHHRAMCGFWTTNWYGTGSQDEYERAAALPLCVRCSQWLPENVTPSP